MSWTDVHHGKSRKGELSSGSPWTCKCGFRNFNFRTSCFECGNEAPNWAQRLGKQPSKPEQSPWKQHGQHGQGDETQALKKQ
eukprot:2374913-Heterocapsa_arctica.AAC.1